MTRNSRLTPPCANANTPNLVKSKAIVSTGDINSLRENLNIESAYMPVKIIQSKNVVKESHKLNPFAKSLNVNSTLTSGHCLVQNGAPSFMKIIKANITHICIVISTCLAFLVITFIGMVYACMLYQWHPRIS